MPEHHEAEVRHRRVGDQLLGVVLHVGHERAVDDADHRQDAMTGAAASRGQREHRHGEAQEAVGAELQQHAGQDHRAAGGRLDVRVGQPGVQREERHLDGEGQREGAEAEQLRPDGSVRCDSCV